MRNYILLLKDIGLIASLPIIATLAFHFHNQKISIIEHQKDILKAQIEQLNQQVKIKSSMSYSNSIDELNTQEKIYEKKLNEYKNKIDVI